MGSPFASAPGHDHFRKVTELNRLAVGGSSFEDSIRWGGSSPAHEMDGANKAEAMSQAVPSPMNSRREKAIRLSAPSGKALSWNCPKNPCVREGDLMFSGTAYHKVPPSSLG